MQATGQPLNHSGDLVSSILEKLTISSALDRPYFLSEQNARRIGDHRLAQTPLMQCRVAIERGTGVKRRSEAFSVFVGMRDPLVLILEAHGRMILLENELVEAPKHFLVGPDTHPFYDRLNLRPTPEIPRPFQDCKELESHDNISKLVDYFLAVPDHESRRFHILSSSEHLWIYVIGRVFDTKRVQAGLVISRSDDRLGATLGVGDEKIVRWLDPESNPKDIKRFLLRAERLYSDRSIEVPERLLKF